MEFFADNLNVLRSRKWTQIGVERSKMPMGPEEGVVGAAAVCSAETSQGGMSNRAAEQLWGFSWHVKS
jgi:hypothetical protein